LSCFFGFRWGKFRVRQILRITMVAARYFPFLGGIETHIHEVGKRMAALGHRVDVITTDPSRVLPEYEVSNGINIKRVKAWPKNRDYYFSPRLYKEIAQAECDIIHFQGYHNFVPPIGMLAAIRRGIPFVLTFHSGGHSSRLRNAIRGTQIALLKPLAARADYLIGVSGYEAEFFSQQMGLAPGRFAIVPNGASLPPPSDPRPVMDPHLILSVGRLEHYKGHHRAVEAFPALLKRVPAARLQIVGSGPYETELRALVNKLKLSHAVSFISIPSSERQRLTDLLCSAGLVVLLSDYEAHPVAVMEALSLQRPVLVTDTSGLRELAQKGLCRSIPLLATAEMIAEAIAEALTKEHQPTAVPLPNWDDCTEQLLGVYETVVNRYEPDLMLRARHYI
jgi:glycosyltransferase involved in cell wall biosynthesis